MRAFLFDLDGTLVDSERQNAESVARALAARGRVITDEERQFIIGHGWREIYARLHAAGGVDLGFDELIAAAVHAKEQIVDEQGLPEVAGAVAFVRRARAVGPCAVVSGSSRGEVGFCISRLGLDEELPWYVGAEDVSVGKPSPEGYLAAARHLEVAPADCVVFEDSSAGVAAARAAGMYCVALAAANFGGQDQSQADLRVMDFLEIGDRFFATAK